MRWLVLALVACNPGNKVAPETRQALEDLDATIPLTTSCDRVPALRAKYQALDAQSPVDACSDWPLRVYGMRLTLDRLDRQCAKSVFDSGDVEMIRQDVTALRTCVQLATGPR